MVGGMASDDFRMEKTFTFIFVDDDVCTDAVGIMPHCLKDASLLPA